MAESLTTSPILAAFEPSVLASVRQAAKARV
jgi:hypothetical protein